MKIRVNLTKILPIYFLLFPIISFKIFGGKIYEFFSIGFIYMYIFCRKKIGNKINANYLNINILIIILYVASAFYLSFDFLNWKTNLANFKFYEKPYIWNFTLACQLILAIGVIEIFRLKKELLDYKKIYMFIMAQSFIQFLVAVYQKFLIHKEFPTGFFTEKGPFGLYLVINVIFIDLVSERLKFTLKKTLILNLFFLMAIFITTSGRAFLVYSIWKILYYLFYNQRISKKTKFFIFIIFMAIVYFFLYEYIFIKLNEFIQLIFFATPERMKIIVGRFAAPYVLKNIFESGRYFGVGFGNYIYARSSEIFGKDIMSTITFGKDYANNVFLEVICENGLLSIVYMYFIFKYFLGNFNENRSIKIIIIILILNLTIINDYNLWYTVLIFTIL